MAKRDYRFQNGHEEIIMQIKKWLIGTALTVGLAAAHAQTTLRLGMQLPETHPSYQGALEIKNTLEKLSKGAMTLRIFPNSQLGDFKAMVADPSW